MHRYVFYCLWDWRLINKRCEDELTLFYPECVDYPGAEVLQLQVCPTVQEAGVELAHVLHPHVHLPTQLTCSHTNK